MKAGSNCKACHFLAVIAIHTLVTLRASAWFEWIPTLLNPGDVTTRLPNKGHKDPAYKKSFHISQDLAIILKKAGVTEIDTFQCDDFLIHPPDLESSWFGDKGEIEKVQRRLEELFLHKCCRINIEEFIHST